MNCAELEHTGDDQFGAGDPGDAETQWYRILWEPRVEWMVVDACRQADPANWQSKVSDRTGYGAP